jgi:hypothetical protein
MIKIMGLEYASLRAVYDSFKNDNYPSYSTFVINYRKINDIERLILMNGRLGKSDYSVTYKGKVYASLFDLSRALYPRHKSNRLATMMRAKKVSISKAVALIKRMDERELKEWDGRKKRVKESVSDAVYKFLYAEWKKYKKDGNNC